MLQQWLQEPNGAEKAAREWHRCTPQDILWLSQCLCEDRHQSLWDPLFHSLSQAPSQLLGPMMTAAVRHAARTKGGAPQIDRHLVEAASRLFGPESTQAELLDHHLAQGDAASGRGSLRCLYWLTVPRSLERARQPYFLRRFLRDDRLDDELLEVLLFQPEFHSPQDQALLQEALARSSAFKTVDLARRFDLQLRFGRALLEMPERFQAAWELWDTQPAFDPHFHSHDARPHEWAWLSLALTCPRQRLHYFAARHLDSKPQEPPPSLLEALVQSALDDPDPSFCRAFVEPAHRYFGADAVALRLLEALLGSSERYRWSALNAFYWLHGPYRDDTRQRVRSGVQQLASSHRDPNFKAALRSIFESIPMD